MGSNIYGRGFEGPNTTGPRYQDEQGRSSTGGVIYGPDGKPTGQRSQGQYSYIVQGQPRTFADQGDEWSMSQSLQDFGSDNSRDFLYRGDPNAEARDVQRARDWAAHMQGRAAPQADLRNALAARTKQTALGGDLEAATMGRGPSLADIQMNRGMSAAALGAAAGGSGAAGQRSALLGAADAGAGAAYGAAGTRAGEIQGARGELGALHGAMRQQDAAAALGQAGLNLRQRQANDAATLGYEHLGQQTGALGMQGRQDQGSARRTWANMAMEQGLRDQAEIDRKNRERVTMGIGAVNAVSSALGKMGGM